MKLPEKRVLPYFLYGIASVVICYVLVSLVDMLPGAVLSVINIFIKYLSPFIYGFGIAFIFNPIMNKLEYKLFPKIKTKKPHPKLYRILSLVLTYLAAIVLIAILFVIVTPELIKSIENLIANLSVYAETVSDFLFSVFSSENEIVNQFLELLPQIQIEITKFLTDTVVNFKNIQSIFELGKGLVSGVINIFVGIVISIYILTDKDILKARFKKFIYAVLPPSFTKKLIYWLSFSGQSFSNYISGSLISSTMVGLICFIVMTILDWPFALLISVIIAVTNLIPFFGPLIGAIPSAIILFVNDPLTAFFFIIFILVLQQIEGNIIAPHIIGDSVGLSPIWIVFSILLFGGLFGIPGMILGIPVFTVIYAIIRSLINKWLEKKGLPTETTEYMTANAKKYNLENAERLASKRKISDILKEMFSEKHKPDDDDKSNK
ncbi:MAG: AI-2E family transporter [Clostridia bacterium]|nr:AI-2E family transporter [Clostridia bacterium]MBR2327867.1 AI-2E family transporter [Clostridia bacterium]